MKSKGKAIGIHLLITRSWRNIFGGIGLGAFGGMSKNKCKYNQSKTCFDIVGV